MVFIDLLYRPQTIPSAVNVTMSQIGPVSGIKTKSMCSSIAVIASNFLLIN